MRVTQLAQTLKISADTVRFYTRQGFLKPSKNPSNGYKDYREQDVLRLRFILSARQLGFSVDDVAHILGEADKGKTPCPLVRRLVDQRLHEIEQRFKDTVLLRKRMLTAVNEWSKKPDKAPTGKMICHLIEEFAQEC